jgi:hypothetical protein
MQPFVSRRSLFAASLLAVLGLAADPNDAGPDATPVADAAPEAAGRDAASDDSSVPDATLPAADAAGEATDDGATPAADTGTTATPEGMGFVQDDGGLPTYSGPNIFDSLCIERPDTTPFVYANVKAPYTTPADCKAFAPAAGHSAARACLCDSCFTLQQQCDALDGCKTIQKCGWTTGCHDSNSCYLAQGLCAKQIDTAGTGSVSTALSQALETCGASNMCPVQ